MALESARCGPHRNGSLRHGADCGERAARGRAAALRGARPLRRVRESARMGARRMSTQHAYAHVTFISAGAGSGKTYRLTQELEHALVRDGMNPARVIGTTFTVKAAEELRERVRERLIRSGRPQLAEQSTRALIGTVHSVCERLLKRFAFELGLSPELNVVSVEDSQGFFHQALDAVLDPSTVGKMNEVADRLGLPAWQNDVKRIADAA